MRVERYGMDVHIDWVSFTLPIGEGANIVTFGDFLHEADRLLLEIGTQHYEYIRDGKSFDMLVGRAPYRYQLQRDDRGVRIFGGGANRTILFELTGRACEGLRGQENYKPFMAPLVERITRLDLACDIRTATRPSEFSNDRNNQRFRSVGFQRSETGETCYIGSTKSDRFARVYRYNHPHPRSQDLRIEYVFRKRLAQSACEALLAADSLMDLAAQTGVSFGFSHPDWNTGIENPEALKVPIVPRTSNDTVAWLYKAVAPSIRRMLEEGSLDWQEYVDYIWNGDNDPRE